MIETLIQAGASVDVRDDPKTAVDSTFGYTPLHAAAFNGNPLYAEGWHTPLGFAVTGGKPKMVRFLLDRGADAGICSPDGRTLYEIAKEKDHEEVAEMLKT